MSTFKARQKWIRRQAFAILILVVLTFFPGLPQSSYEALIDSGLYENSQNLFRNALRHGSETGDPSPEHLQSMGSTPVNSFEVNVDMLESISEAFILEQTDPELAFAIYKRAADNGSYFAQNRILERAGVDMNDSEAYLSKLYEYQLVNPGWKPHFESALSGLHELAASGNAFAISALDQLYTL